MANSSRAWKGSLAIEPGRAAFIGRAGDTQQHRHHAIQVAVALENPIRLEIGTEGSVPCRAVAVGADVAHAIDCGGDWIGLYYLEADSEPGRILDGALRPPGWTILDESVADVLETAFQRFASSQAGAGLSSLSGRVAEALGLDHAAVPPRPSEVVDAAIRTLDELVPDEVRVAELAQGLGVRQRDLSAAFRQGTGLSIRSYVLWLRLQRAVRALSTGDNLTRAALSAGFSDSAHLSRVFRETFGVSPSVGIGRTRISTRIPSPS